MIPRAGKNDETGLVCLRACLQIASLGLMVLGSPAAAQGAPDDGQRYETCLAQVDLDARVALAAAQAWTDGGGGAPAQHCAALALIGLQHYEKAGQILLALASGEGSIDALMRADFYAQAGNAFLLAGSAENARAAFDLALELKPDDAAILTDRARADALRKDWKEAIADLDRVIALTPLAPEPYVLRASAKRLMGDLAGAGADLALALMRDPTNAGALLERGIVSLAEGNRDAARADFEQVLAIAPGSTVAREAKARLAAMN